MPVQAPSPQPGRGPTNSGTRRGLGAGDNAVRGSVARDHAAGSNRRYIEGALPVVRTCKSRSRFGDVARVCMEPSLDFDESGNGYVETRALAGRHKQGHQLKKIGMSLPMVAIARTGPSAKARCPRRREASI